MARYRLWVRFTAQGLQWPLQDGDEIEVRTATLETVARLPANLIEALIAHHLDGLAVQAYLSDAVHPGAWRQLPVIEMTRKPLAPAAPLALPDADRRAALRAKRKMRKRPS